MQLPLVLRASVLLFNEPAQLPGSVSQAKFQGINTCLQV